MGKEHKKDKSAKTPSPDKRHRDADGSSRRPESGSSKDHHHKHHHKDRSSSKDHSHHHHKKHNSNSHHNNHVTDADRKQPVAAAANDVKPTTFPKLDPASLQPLNDSDILGAITSSIRGFSDDFKSSSFLLKPKSEPVYDPNLGFTSRKARTLVYAGHSRAAHTGIVPRLEDLCLNLLADNIDKITCLGDAPYYLLKPVLSKCTPVQLRRIEKYNEHLIDDMDTDELWKLHAEQEFKGCPGKSRKESFREYFHRSQHERDVRLKRLTSKIQKKSVKDREPVKKTMVVESVPAKGRKLPAGTKSSTHATAVTAAEIKKNAKDVRVGTAKPERRTGPLMKKTMQMFKQVCRR